MKITIPIETEVNLTAPQRILFLKEWVYKWLKEIESEGSNYPNSNHYLFPLSVVLFVFLHFVY